MRADELGAAPPRRILLVNPPVVVVDRVQLDYYADAIPYGLHQIATWLSGAGHEVHLADMMGYGKHRHGWEELLARGELGPLGRLPSGAPGLDLEAWLYGRPLDWLDPFVDGLPGEPDEVWVSTTLLFDAFLGHEVVRWARKRLPRARVRLGGDAATLSPEHAARSGADEVWAGRLPAADLAVPDLAAEGRRLGFAIFRLTSGCPRRCAFCVNRIHPLQRYPIEPVLDAIERARSEAGVRSFDNWDPNILAFRDHLEAFLEALGRRRLDVELRFDMGFEPDLVDDGVVRLVTSAPVRSFTLPVETTDPRFFGLFEKPYTVLSTIRAMERLRRAGFDLGACHASSIVGFPEEDLAEVFAVFHVVAEYGLTSTPFPIVPLPTSKVWERYRDRVEGRPFRALNGHLFPLLGSAGRVELYRRLLLLLTSSGREVADRVVRGLPEPVQEAYEQGRSIAARLLEGALDSDAPDGVELLRRVRA